MSRRLDTVTNNDALNDFTVMCVLLSSWRFFYQGVQSSPSRHAVEASLLKSSVNHSLKLCVFHIIVSYTCIWLNFLTKFMNNIWNCYGTEFHVVPYAFHICVHTELFNTDVSDMYAFTHASASVSWFLSPLCFSHAPVMHMVFQSPLKWGRMHSERGICRRPSALKPQYNECRYDILVITK